MEDEEGALEVVGAAEEASEAVEVAGAAGRTRVPQTL
jgi:hypothetical protein